MSTLFKQQKLGSEKAIENLQIGLEKLEITTVAVYGKNSSKENEKGVGYISGLREVVVKQASLDESALPESSSEGPKP